METTETVEVPQNQSSPSKLCQSCIERGYTPRIATRVWTNGYNICEECYQPLLSNILAVPSHFSDVLTSDQILSSRDEIFNYHHSAIVNKSGPELIAMLEDYKKILFTIRIYAEDVQTEINRLRAIERAKNNLSAPEKLNKGVQEGAARKEKLSRDDKLKKQLAKNLGITVAELERMGKEAKHEEFKSFGASIVKETKNDLVVPTEKTCPYCTAIVPSLLVHYKDCDKKPKLK